MKLHSQHIRFNADTYTPVKLYLALRNKHRKTCLLESNDYHSRQNSKSFIGLDPLVEITQKNQTISIDQNGKSSTVELDNKTKYKSQLQSLLNQFTFEIEEHNGFFGRLNFEFTQPDETHLDGYSDQRIPLVHLFIFRYIIVIDHFTNDGHIIENSLDQSFRLSHAEELLNDQITAALPFEVIGNERSMYSDDVFKERVEKGIEHCQRGDVFQLVLSNEFEQSFFGDDFQVYRQLRRLNPSPYLFYFDFEKYRLFGSSPEAQIVIKNGTCEIHPIAGTVPRTGIEETDEAQLEFLLKDEKENAEHTMLVDLARNDLSKNCHLVKVDRYKEVQHFSHVTHLVSKVTGKMKEQNNFETLCNSFPAGTLSGTPKSRALELISSYEPRTRDYYGGAIGILSPQQDLNMAIVIRSILSMNNTLYYRAGAGIVIDSIPEREVAEVHHKLRAVRKAIALTEKQFTQQNQLS